MRPGPSKRITCHHVETFGRLVLAGNRSDLVTCNILQKSDTFGRIRISLPQKILKGFGKVNVSAAAKNVSGPKMDLTAITKKPTGIGKMNIAAE